MTDRIPLDHLTSDQYDALYAEVDRLTAELADYVRRAEQLEDSLSIAYTTSNRSEAERARAVQRAETAEHRLSLAHHARRAKEHQLDDIRRALCDAGFIRDDDPYSHADLADVIRQAAPAEDRVAELSTPNRPTFRNRAETAERNERELRAQIREYEDATTWQTTCLSCADTRNEIARQLERAEQATLRAERAEAALERVRALHRKASHGETCVYCAHGQRLGYDTTWPCDTIRAIAEPASGRGASTATAGRHVHVTITSQDPYTANRAALSLVDWIRAEFPGMHVTTDAREWGEETPAPNDIAATEAEQAAPTWRTLQTMVNRVREAIAGQEQP